MRIHNVRSRELPAPVDLAWELVADLASEHDELLEDLLDNAERAAGGCPAAPPPLPRRLRVANAVEGGVIRLRRNPLVPAARS